MTAKQKEWLAREEREAEDARLFLDDSRPIAVAWAEAAKDDRKDLILFRSWAILRMFAEGSLRLWENKCSTPEEWIEEAVESTKEVLAKNDVSVGERGIYSAVSVWAGFGTFDSAEEVESFRRKAKNPDGRG